MLWLTICQWRQNLVKHICLEPLKQVGFLCVLGKLAGPLMKVGFALAKKFLSSLATMTLKSSIAIQRETVNAEKELP